MPLDPNITLIPNPDGNVGDCSNSFARLLGELQYIANATHPDITYMVNRLTSYIASLSMQHTIVLKQIPHYLSGTRTHSITYKALPKSKEFFSGYADVAYGNADKNRLTTSYNFLAGNRVITWYLRKQISTALSSMEAEGP